MTQLTPIQLEDGTIIYPYVTKGTAESNLKITVKCSFPDQSEKKTQQS
ncbi:hypothetical protein GNF10_20825 [Nostoc sp. UCD121]|nr:MULTISPECIES: CU044_2847 family protein [unclassified Nostoc]MBC1221261.1 hypothetical protein [Nostoc sp. UCD120]MBC1278340.1 hypothetical protein [Nostoc sp. UCD121]MBC1297013.1 hypothetical protein [Nostoc sp. UCD122]